MNCPKHFTFRYTLEQPRESGGEFEQSGYCRVAGGPGNNYSPQAPISPPCKCSSIYVTLLSCLMPRPSLPPSSMYVQCNHLLYLLHVRNFNVFVGITTIGHSLKRGAHTAALFFNKFIVFSSLFTLHHPIIGHSTHLCLVQAKSTWILNVRTSNRNRNPNPNPNPKAKSTRILNVRTDDFHKIHIYIY